MTDGVNTEGSDQPTTLNELDVDGDDHEKQISNNILPAGEHKARKFSPIMSLKLPMQQFLT